MVTKTMRQSSRSYKQRQALVQTHFGRTPQRDPLFISKNQSTLLGIIAKLLGRFRIKQPK